MKKTITAELAKEFIEGCNLQEEFKEWADESEEDLDYLMTDFAEADCGDRFEEWYKEAYGEDFEEDEEPYEETYADYLARQSDLATMDIDED